MRQMAEEVRGRGDSSKALAPLRPKPEDLPTTTATVTTSRWRTNPQGEPELVEELNDDGKNKLTILTKILTIFLARNT